MSANSTLNLKCVHLPFADFKIRCLWSVILVTWWWVQYFSRNTWQRVGTRTCMCQAPARNVCNSKCWCMLTARTHTQHRSVQYCSGYISCVREIAVLPLSLACTMLTYSNLYLCSPGGVLAPRHWYLRTQMASTKTLADVTVIKA
jgi:hypothetical protein